MAKKKVVRKSPKKSAPIRYAATKRSVKKTPAASPVMAAPVVVTPVAPVVTQAPSVATVQPSLSSDQKPVWGWYLWLSLIYTSVFTILGGIVTTAFGDSIQSLSGVGVLMAIIGGGLFVLHVVWAIFSLVMLIVMFATDIERKALWIPGLYLIDVVFSIVCGIIIGIIGAVQGSKGLATSDPLTWVGLVLGLIFPVIILFVLIKYLRSR